MIISKITITVTTNIVGKDTQKSLLSSWLWSTLTTGTTTTPKSSLSSLLEEEEGSTTTKFVHALRMKLQEKIGVEGLEDDDRKQQKIKDIWNENEKTLQRLKLVKEEQELEQPPSVKAAAASTVAVVQVVTTEDENKKNANGNGTSDEKDDDGLSDLLTEVTTGDSVVMGGSGYCLR